MWYFMIFPFLFSWHFLDPLFFSGPVLQETLASQLRCVRGVSEHLGKCLARNHPNIQSFLSAMLKSKDPVILGLNASNISTRMAAVVNKNVSERQWLIDKAAHGRNPSSLRRSTATLLAETLAGKDALKHENFILSLEAWNSISISSILFLSNLALHFQTGWSSEAINGVTRKSAVALVAHFGNREKMQQFLKGAHDWKTKSVGHENEWSQFIYLINSILPKQRSSLMKLVCFPEGERDPVSALEKLAGLSRPTRLALVEEFVGKAQSVCLYFHHERWTWTIV